MTINHSRLRSGMIQAVEAIDPNLFITLVFQPPRHHACGWRTLCRGVLQTFGTTCSRKSGGPITPPPHD